MAVQVYGLGLRVQSQVFNNEGSELTVCSDPVGTWQTGY
jgi:hypothetical protein